MATEVVSCGPCLKAARGGESGPMGRWLAWDDVILQQLSEAHRARFPAVLTAKRGVDKTVIRLLRDRTEGNTMIKVWRQVQENHMEDYHQRKDLYTTLLMALVKPGGIVSALGHGDFQAAPLPRELPCARLLRHAFLLAEADNVQDYRSQILSTFGIVVKKLSGEGKGSAEWFTSIGNEFSQIVSFVLTCEESVEKLGPMCHGVVERFRLANQPVPKILYIDRGCCKAQGPTAVETLFQPWVDNGMVVRLDIFHWIHRFDAALRTEAHSKYAAFKSALGGAVLAYNREDLQLLITAVRAKDPTTLEVVTDEDVVRRYISRDQLQHHVRRLTLGAQETFRLVHLVIEELKGPAGLDESGVSLFKNRVLESWNAVEEHDKQPQKYHQLYRTHWGNTLYCRTKRDDLADAALIQRVKMAKRYAPAQQDISMQNNRLMYVLVKLLWLRAPKASRSSPEKTRILNAYDRIQHRVLVDDPVLCKAGIPLPKINTKTVRDFIRQQERLVNLHATRQPAVISKTNSVSSEKLPPAPRQPAVLPPPDYPVMEYVPTPSTAGTKVLKGRTNMLVTTPQPLPQLPPQPPLPLPVRRIPATSTITRPVLPFVSQSAGPSSTQPAGQASVPITPPVPIRPAVQPASGQNPVVGS
ncbi:hypothetical protein FQN60_017508, partial [Etheostoma spectabile]